MIWVYFLWAVNRLVFPLNVLRAVVYNVVYTLQFSIASVINLFNNCINVIVPPHLGSYNILKTENV